MVKWLVSGLLLMTHGLVELSKTIKAIVFSLGFWFHSLAELNKALSHQNRRPETSPRFRGVEEGFAGV